MNSKFYVSFGHGHNHILNNKIFNKNCVCEIVAENLEHAREIAFKFFGAKWCWIYCEHEVKIKLFSRGIVKL